MDVFETVAELLDVNCYVVSGSAAAEVAGKRECILIDAGFDCTPGHLTLCAEEDLLPVAIFLTHGHPDHILGLPQMLSHWDVPVYLAAADHYRAADPAATMSAALRPFIQPLVANWQAPAVADLDQHETLELAGLSITPIAAPGHTEGSTLLQIRDLAEPTDERLFTGDVLFAGSIGRTDLPGGNWEQMSQSLQMIKQLPDAPVYPGHGPASRLAHELVTNPFL